MKWLAAKRIAIKSIVLPGNFSATRAAPRITELATLVRRTDGPIHMPVVEAKTMRLLAGHDRIAAMLVLKEKHVWVRPWEGTSQEFREVQVIENLGRRADDPNALTAELVRIEAGIIREEAAESGDPEPAEQTVKAAARKRVAKAKGVTTEAVRTAETRSAKGASRDTPMHRVNESVAAPSVDSEIERVQTLAVSLPDDFNAFGLGVLVRHRDRVVELAATLRAWERGTTNMLTELARLEKANNPPLISRHAAEAIRRQARALGHVVREAIPTSLCYYCKNDVRGVVDCPACGATGLVGRHAGDDVPAELKVGGAEARIAIGGRFILISDVGPSTAGQVLPGGSKHAPAVGPKPATKRGMRVVAVDESGNEIDVPQSSGNDDEELAF